MDGEPSEQETQLLQILREWSGNDDYCLSIEYGDGVWEIALSAAPGGKRSSARGSGRTFEEAWDSMAPSSA